jgi:hypothetical protein
MRATASRARPTVPRRASRASRPARARADRSFDRAVVRSRSFDLDRRLGTRVSAVSAVSDAAHGDAARGDDARGARARRRRRRRRERGKKDARDARDGEDATTRRETRATGETRTREGNDPNGRGSTRDATRRDARSVTDGARWRQKSRAMGKNLIVSILRVVPLALYLRSAACKFAIPIAGCDGALCPVALGKPGDCAPTANTAEQYAWCEHAWTPWANGLIARVPGVSSVAPKIRCSKADGYEFAKIIGALEVLGYLALWTTPARGAFLLTAIMAGAIHFHMTFLKDPIGKLTIQFALLFASATIAMLTTEKKAKKKATTKSKSTRRTTSSRKTKRG